MADFLAALQKLVGGSQPGPQLVPEFDPNLNPYLKEIYVALAGHPLAYSEKATLKVIDGPLQRLKAAPAEEQRAFLFEALRRPVAGTGFPAEFAIKGVTGALLRGGLPLSAEQVVRLVELVSQPRTMQPFKAVLGIVEKMPMTPELKEALRRLRPAITEWIGGTEMREIHQRIDALLQGPKEIQVLPAGEWSRLVFAEFSLSFQKGAWLELFSHTRTLTQSTASRKWQTEAVGIVDRIGRKAFLEAADRWLALGPEPASSISQVPDAEADYQKGFIWALGAVGDPAAAPAIADFAIGCFRKIPQIGAVSHRVGNACVNALAVMPGLAAVGELSRLATRVKYDVARRLIEKALAEAAARNNVSRDDLEAMSVPTFGLDASGVRVEAAGTVQATLSIEDGGGVLRWTRDGKALKSPPAEVKENHPTLLAELKKSLKELDATLSARRLRLERQLASTDSCTFDRWMAWYIEHPVTSTFARRLIWEFELPDGSKRSAIWSPKGLMDWAGQPVSCGDAEKAAVRVRLWHPIRSNVQEILSWRCRLEDDGVRQPFKQAHREVYILTDAERETGDHSNRFASHIIRQHQFAALCRERGWQFNLMGQWDSHNTPELTLPQHGVRVTLDVDFPPNEEDVSGHFIYMLIATGAVRFYPVSKKGAPAWPGPKPMRLEEVSPLLFSEVMRDIDLFIGVTSIGSDPALGAPGAAPNRHVEYWSAFAFGELTAAAENRKSVLERLIPKLSIKDRCRIDGRFLVVRGDLHEYRIHIGSSNIIMEPGSRYLCIVHGGGDTAASLPLPFDGDRQLALILSKALLLANDKAIKDPAIARQLG